MITALDWSMLVTALACSMAGGSLFPFSNFAMAGLKRLPARDGIAAMQSINVRALGPASMALLFGTGLAVIAVSVWSLVDGSRPVGWVLAGSLVYLVGIPGITLALNVPLNIRLERLDPNGPEAAEFWAHYNTSWTAYNHVRVGAGLLAGALLIIALAG